MNRLLAPKLAARDTMDEGAMHELIESIRDVGLLQPLVVEEEGQYFRIHAGHRRSIACGALELETVPCMIWPAGCVPGEAVKSHENAFREDLNPAEEALYFRTLYQTVCGEDTDALAALVKRKRALVEDRLLLIGGDADVFESLRRGLIGVGVAEELNQVKDRGMRMVFLSAAAQGGAKTTQVRLWRKQYENSLTNIAELPLPDPNAPPKNPHHHEAVMRCFLCDGTEEAHTFVLLWVHGPCKKLLLDPTLQKLGLTAADEES